MRKQYKANDGKWKADTGMETDNKVEKVINLKSCRTRLALRREPTRPAHLKREDRTILSRNIIITYPATLFIQWERRIKTFLNTQGLKMGREIGSREFEEREYLYYSLR